jgi:hypothetical protein
MGILAGGGDTSAASTKSELRQQQAQLGKRLYRSPRLPQFHAHALSRAEHPGWQHDDDAWGRLNVHHFAAYALLAVLALDAPPVQCMPTVEDLDFLRDMRRMTP